MFYGFRGNYSALSPSEATPYLPLLMSSTAFCEPDDRLFICADAILGQYLETQVPNIDPHCVSCHETHLNSQSPGQPGKLLEK